MDTKGITIALLIILSVRGQVQAQVYHNEWIDHGQYYYEIPIAQDGIYRISKSELKAAGVPVDAIDPRNIQVFARGREQAIYLQGESDGIFHESDFLEFYATANDGWLDGITAYADAAAPQGNPYYSLYNDTIRYFLTWNSSLSNNRMNTSTDQDYAAYASPAYCFREWLHVYKNSYYSASNGPLYTSGTGWYSTAFNLGGQLTRNIGLSGLYTASGEVKIYTAVVGASNASSASYKHHLQISLGPPLSSVSFDTLYYAYDVVPCTLSFPASSAEENIEIKFNTINDLSLASDRNAVAYVRAVYPASFDFGGTDQASFSLAASTGKQTINLSGINEDGQTVLYGLTDQTRISGGHDGSSYRAVIPAHSGQNDYYLSNENGITQLSSDDLTAVHSSGGQKGYFTDFSNTASGKDFIIITHRSLWTEALQYQSYRNSSGYNCMLIDVDELYSQFSYGIYKNPYAIRNFLRQVFALSNPPKHLLLLGKGLHTHYWRKSTGYYNSCLLPTLGNGGNSSDLLLSEGLDTVMQYCPAMSTGRIAARNGDHVLLYLNKLQEYESAPRDEWMKRVLHFGGGGTTYEQQKFKSYLNNYKAIIEDTLYGGNVISFFKNSSQVIEFTASDTIRKLINDGASLLTFFGHASANGFDQDIDEPDVYDNKGRYALLLANSCYAGDIYLPGSDATSEDWVLIKDKGVIGFHASVGLGYESYLNFYSSELYKQLAYKSYNQPFGTVVKNTCWQLLGSYPGNTSIRNTILEFTFHGDPALSMNMHNKPDLYMKEANVQISPEPLTTASDSMTVGITVLNIGQATYEPFIVNITRTYPDGSEDQAEYLMEGCLWSNSFSLNLPVDPIKGPGLNKLTIYADAAQQVDELSELNNSVTINFGVTTNKLIPIFPYEYAIHPTNTAVLKASTGNPFADERTYVFQIDTTDLFSSPLMREGQVKAPGGVVSWDPQISFGDSVVYYWRCSALPGEDGDHEWGESSFIYIPEKTGWSQAHYFQFKNDDYNLTEYNRPERQFDYITAPVELRCYNIGSPSGADFNNILFKFGEYQDYSACYGAVSMLVVVIDPVSLEVWQSDDANYGHFNYPKCISRGRPDNYFIFTNYSTMAGFLDNDVPDGFHVLAYSFRGVAYSAWPEAAHAALENLGAASIRDIPDGFPYIFYAQKGDISTAVEKIGSSSTAEISLRQNIYTNATFGYIRSTLIGPAILWGSFHWDWQAREEPNYDQQSVELIGIGPDGITETSLDTIQYQKNILNLYDFVDASQYPYLRLRLITRDDSARTPSQLKKWQVTYTPLPETAINPSAYYRLQSDTLQEAEQMHFAIATENISLMDMDSLLVRFWLQDADNNTIDLGRKRLAPHPSGDVLIDSVSFDTYGSPGLNSVWVEFNPVVESKGTYDQLEQYHFNNIAFTSFYVLSDRYNPILDISFDGRHIMDGDLVSARPDILIRLKDENKHLALDDTSLVDVWLTPPDGQEQRLPFTMNNGSEFMQFSPASLPDNTCQINLQPTLSQDGLYTLKVQARDVSRNQSGDNEYAISFEVVNKATITHLFNYPNPFSTSTRFVFTLTGSRVPDRMSIQIMTITGTVVKVIEMDELGPIHVGDNITQYAWDGTDMYGDRLANGVYFYRVIVEMDGKSIERRTTPADHMFEKNLGKMYLIR